MIAEICEQRLEITQQEWFGGNEIIKKMSPEPVAIAQMPYFSAVDKRDYSNSFCDDYIERPAKQEQNIEVLKKHLINNA